MRIVFLLEVRKYEENRCWLGITLGDMLQRAADFYPDKEALLEGKTRMSYSVARRQVNQKDQGHDH